ncbi:mCG1042309, partial [Mus musculus]
ASRWASGRRRRREGPERARGPGSCPGGQRPRMGRGVSCPSPQAGQWQHRAPSLLDRRRPWGEGWGEAQMTTTW